MDAYQSDSHLFAVELNTSYFIQAMALRHSDIKEKILLALFERHAGNPYLRRQIILTMARWQRHYLLTDVRRGSKMQQSGNVEPSSLLHTGWAMRAIIGGRITGVCGIKQR